MKYIVVTGGVLSGLGKGITASSIGRLLKSRGLKVTAVKIDPYVNCDAGTMNPFEHGEVFVLDDGGEADLDLGNYERFLDIELGRDNNITTGKVYKAVIEKERRGEYLGKTVQIVPHVTNEIRDRIERVAAQSGADICIIEAGGTVGDIESMPFLEALRQLRIKVGREQVVFVHCTLVPVMGVVGEQKTKPTQHSVAELRSLGIDPDVLVCRSEHALEEKTKQKLALFCDVDAKAVLSAPDARTIYEVPIILEQQGIAEWLIERFGLSKQARARDLEGWRKFVERILNPRTTVTIAVVGKYTALADSYLSIGEAFKHAGAELWTQVKVKWVDSEEIERGLPAAKALADVHGVLVAPGFGARGTEGKIAAIRHAREQGLPYLGICFGFQLAVVEYTRHVLGHAKANSTEIDPGTPDPVIDLLPEQKHITEMGGTMRLGGSPIHVQPGTLAHRLYGEATIRERHRHRYEVNPPYIPKLEKAGLVFSGKHTNGVLMEIAELPTHPFFVGSQYHPEFRSRPERPAPLFLGLVEAALKRQSKAGP
ncbi:MAG TPA: CTP synthase [Candidatus Thermoplasmatota archaeon]|jgi:CTP synthase|nr:CTP synthase [Candidatus Thermoplasmatota archaeon]